MITTRNLTKGFAGRPALTDLNLEVPEGTIYGLLGHNGAGKSTTIGLLLGHLMPDAGSSQIGGVDVQVDRARAVGQVGAIFETPAFYGYLSGYRNLQIFAHYSRQVTAPEIDATVRLAGLEERIHDRVRTYSHGMRQRLALAQALLPRPALLILDEPTDGLDPEGIREMRHLIQALNQDHGLTILLSSHLLGEMEQVCHQIGILRQGRLLFSGDWRAAAFARRRFHLSADRPADCAAALREAGLATPRPPTPTPEEAGGGERAQASTGIELHAGVVPADCIDHLVGRGLRLHAFAPADPTLEEYYLEVLREDDGGGGGGG